MRPNYPFSKILPLLALFLIPFIAQTAYAAVPSAERVFPENIQGDTIYLRLGEDISFSVSGHDDDGNLRGVEWYENGTFLSPATLISPSTDSTFTKTLTFSTAGTYLVTARVFDTDNNYDSSFVKWNIKVASDSRAMYATISSVAGVAEAEDSLISYALENNIHTIFAYGTNQLVNTTYPSDKERLSSFIQKARTSGIEKILMVAGRGQDLRLLDSVYSYQSNPAYADIDGIVMEFEYWNDQNYGFCDGRTACFDSTLSFFDHAADLFSTPDNVDFKAGIYLGNSEPDWEDKYASWLAEAEVLEPKIDFALLHYYTPKSGESIYLAGKRTRLQAFLDASQSAPHFELMPLFSMEYADYYPHNNSGLYALDDIESWWFSAFGKDSLTNKFEAKITRPAFFTYAYMDDDQIYPPLQMNFRRTYQGTTNATDTIYIELGDTVLFRSKVDDFKASSSSNENNRYPVDDEGDLQGAEWYINGVHYSNTLVPTPTATTANVRNRYEFLQQVIFDSDSVSTYKITVRPFDSGYHYSPRNIEKWVIIQPPSESSLIQSIDEPGNPSGYLDHAYPNPSSDNKVWVPVSVRDQEHARIRVYSMTGHLIMEKRLPSKGRHTIELDFGSLPPGNYVLKVNDGLRENEQHLVKH